jgi:macrolide-specific efflux system membrane fusion protein
MTIEDRINSRRESKALPPAIFVRLRPYRFWALALAGIALLAVLYVVHARSSAAAQPPPTVTATRDDVENVVSAVGNLQPFSTVDVGAQVTGQLKKLYVHIGDDVQPGQPVAQIDSAVAAAKVDADNAQLQNLQAQLADKQSSLALDSAEADRQSHLKSAGATSQTLYDNAQAGLRSARAQVKAVQAQITEAQSTLKADHATLGYADIVAPMAGTVTAIPAKEGQTLNASQQAPVILTISNLATMTVNTQVSEADVPKLHLGMDVYFTTLGDRHRRYPGKLRQILPTPTMVNNVVLYTALFDIPNPGRQLLSQMTAQVFFVLAAAHDVVTVPVAALKFTDADGEGHGRRAAATAQAPRRPATVTVLLPSGTRETRNVVVGVSNRIQAEILSGLKEGDTVLAETDQ